MTAATSRMRVGAYQDRRSVTVVVTRRSASFARGMTIKTMNKMMKGSPAERPPSHDTVAAYLVARASTMPTKRPPAKTKGRLEK